MIKPIIKIIKKVVFAFGILYGINILLNSINIMIPINICTLGISTILGIPGVLSLFAIFFIIN